MSSPKIYRGNLFKITIARIPLGQDFEDPLSAVNGLVDAPVIAIGLIHAFKDDEDGERHYIAYSNDNIFLESESFDELLDMVIETITKAIQLTESEVSELLSILSIQEDADYDLDNDVWTYSLGEGGEVRLSEDFVGAIIVNVTPFYSTKITLEGQYGVADDESCCEDHEFCGAMHSEA